MVRNSINQGNSAIIHRLLRRLCLFAHEDLQSSEAAVSVVREPLIKRFFECALRNKEHRLAELLDLLDDDQFQSPTLVEQRGYARHHPLFESLRLYPYHRKRRLLLADVLAGQALILRYYIHLARRQPGVGTAMIGLCHQHARDVKNEMESTRQVLSAFGGEPRTGAPSYPNNRIVNSEVRLQMGDCHTFPTLDSATNFVVDEYELLGVGD